MMQMTIDPETLAGYTAAQMNALFPDRPLSGAALKMHADRALDRLEYCFSHIHLKYFFDGKSAVFNHLNTDQYAMYLYFLSNSAFRAGGDPSIASKVYALNKALHALDVFYEVALPDIFSFQHPVGTVIGRGNFSDYFFIYNRCSIGANLNNVYPKLGKGVVMFGGSAIIGDCAVGDNVWLSVGATVMDQGVPSGKVVFGQSPFLTIKDTRRDAVREMFLRERLAP